MEFITKFKNYLLAPKSETSSQKNSASAVTVKNYLADVKHFISWFELTYKRPFTPGSITLQTINEFKQAKQESLSASSVERHISTLRKFFTFLKLDGQIASSPFEQAQKPSTEIEDPWHLHDFKNYLYVYNASHLTIKNYLIDVKQFLAWAEEVLRIQDQWNAANKNVFHRIDNNLIEAYKMRLLQQHVFSASSINRKLSSLRKYLSWAGEQGYMAQGYNVQFGSVTNQGLIPGYQADIQTQAEPKTPASQQPVNPIQSRPGYSKIPPIRLFQKMAKAGTLAFDLLVSRPIAHSFRTVEHGKWALKGKPLFVPSQLHIKNHVKRFIPHVRNISKEFYAPLSISTADFPWYKKALHHVRYTRPQWYHRYHQLAIAHYFNWAILIIFSAAIGFGMYNSFVQKPNPSLAALPTAGTRVLSFQGRLTDANDNPITSPSWIRFIIYNDASASGSARLWEEVRKVSPDSDGIFSILMGSDGAGGQAPACSPTPPSSPATGSCGIPQSLFAQNGALWLGVTVEATSELTPREQIATVAYAVNSETLQGLPPITQSGAGTTNVVLALNSSGNLAIGASTQFQSTSGTFTLSGNTLLLNTNSGTNGNITLSPDGTGFVDIQRPIQNSTLQNNILSARGAVEIDDLAAILATSSGQSALTIDQNGTGPIISASHSGTAEFTLDNSGNGTFNGNVTGQTIYTGGGTTYYINNAISNLNSLTLAANLTVSGNVASDLIPKLPTATYSLGDSTHQWLNLYAQNIYSNGSLITNLWQENIGVLSPIHTQDDLALGGTATSDAKFQVFGTTGNATTSGTLTFNTTGIIQTTKNQEFTLGGTSTGNIFLSPQGGNGLVTVNGNLTVNGTTQNVGNGSSYTIQTSSNAGLTLLSSGTGNITLGQNLGNGNVVVHPNAGGQAALVVDKQTTGLAVTGDILTASNSGTTEFRVSSSGNVFGRTFTDLDNVNYFLDPAGVTNSLLVAGTVGIGTTNPLLQSGLDVEKSTLGNATVLIHNTDAANVADLFTASNSAGTKFTIQNDGTIVSGKYTTAGGVFYTTSGGVFTQASNASANTLLHGGSTPTFSAVDLTADVTGTLPINKGGTNGTATPTAGGIAYGTGTAYAFSTAGSSGQCLQSNAASAPTWGACGTGGGATNYWTLNAGAISTYFPSVDILAGSSTYATTSAKFAVTGIAGSLVPAASVSATTASGGTGTGVVIKGDGSIQSLVNGALTIGGNTTGNITLSPLGGNGNVTVNGGALNTTAVSFDLVNTTATTVNLAGAASTINIGAAAGTVNFKASTIDTNQSSLALFATPTTVNFAGAGTTINIGAATGTTTVKNALSVSGNTTLGTNTGNSVTINGLVNASILPSSTSINLGDPGHYWGTVYANNFVAPVSGGTSGFWQLTASVLSPVNFWNDLAVGGNATGSATPWQVFATPYPNDQGTVTSGTATTSGNLIFRGTPASQTAFKVDLLNGSSLAFNRSVGGDKGETAVFTIGNDGNLTDAGNLAVNGGSITSTNSTVNLFTSGVTTINMAASGTSTTFNGSLIFGTSQSNNIGFNGYINTTIYPRNNTIGIGDINNRWGDIYASNLFLPVAGGTDGYWTLASSVLHPTNLWDDLAVGATATGSATPFQVFANSYTTDGSINSGIIKAGTATTSGDLTFRGVSGSQTAFQQNILNGASLGFYTSPGGDKGLTANPSLYFAPGGNVGIGTTTPLTALQISGSASISANLTLYGSNTTHTFDLLQNGTLGFYTSVGGDAGVTAGKPTLYFTNANNSGAVGTVSIGTNSPLAASALHVEKDSLGDSLMLINQLSTNTNADIFTASKSGTPLFTIANDGSIKNSLIPNLVGATGIDTLYNLGAATAEWDTLYVRQIVTPSTGGISGLWQLTNTGILAPANLTNDLTVGSTNGNIATGSAFFQVIGSGVNAGNIFSNSQTTNGNALAIGANSLTTGNAASVSAISLTSGNLLNLISSDPQINSNAGHLSSGNLINVSSTDHSYMTLTNKDLTIGGHKNMQTISNVKKVYFYDTTKDSDGGRWTNDERAATSSWYNETVTSSASCVIGTNKRCGQAAFPRKAIIVVAGQSTYIFDAKDNSMWMEFDKGATTTENMIGPTTNSTSDSVVALNGKIYIGNGGSVGGVYVIDFIHDTSYKYLNTGYSAGGSAISGRNNADTYTLNTSIAIYLPSPNVNDLAINIINGNTYLAVATRGSGNATNVIPPGGSVAFINESLMKMPATFGSVLTVGAIANNVWLTSTGDLYATICQNSSNPCTNFVLKVKHNAQNASGFMSTFSEVYGAVPSGGNGVTTSDNATTGSIVFSPGPSASISANLQPTGLYVTQGTSTVDGKSNTIYLGENGSNGNLAVLQENQASPGAGLVKYYNGNDISEDMVGDTQIMLPFAGAGTLATNTTLTSPDSDVTYHAVPLTTKTATVTHVSGVRGNGLSFNAANSDYLCTGTAGTCADNPALNPLNNNFSMSFWIKTASNSKVIVDKQTTPTTSDGYAITLDSAGRLSSKFQGTANITDVSVRAINDNNWHHIAIVFSRPSPGAVCGAGNVCTLSQYIDGQLDGTGTSTTMTTITNATQMTLMGDSVAGAGSFVTGSLDEFMITSAPLTSSEIARMYQVGYRALQNHNSKSIRGVTIAADASQELINANSVITAVAANMQNGQIYVGTSGGGVSSIGMDTDTVTDLYSSSATTTDDVGTSWNATTNNNFITSIAVGQSYGNGTATIIGNSTASDVWMETQDTALKDFFATSYNPFGTNLTQSSLTVDTMFRITNQISTRLDNLAFNATSSAALDLFQVDNTGSILSRSLYANPTAVQFQDNNGNTLFNLDTSGLGNAAVTLNQMGLGDILTASASGVPEFTVTSGGNIISRKFTDLDNSSYFLDPAAAPGNTALAVAGSVGIGTTSPNAQLDIVGNGATALSGTAMSTVLRTSAGALSSGLSSKLNLASIGFTANTNKVALGIHAFRNSSSGTDWTTSAIILGMDVDNTASAGAFMTLAANGDIGIGTTSPSADLDISGNASLSGSLTFRGTNATHQIYAFNNGNIDFITTPGGAIPTTGLLHALYIQAATANIGIGTTNPADNLDVVGNGSAITTRSGTGISARLFCASATSSCYVGSASNNNFVIRTNDTDRITIDTSGNVGIGSTGPSNKLSIQRSAGNSGTSDLYMSDGTQWIQFNSNESAGSFNGLVAAGDQAMIYSNGSIGTGALNIVPWSSCSGGCGIHMSASGQVAIGTTTVTELLSVNGRVAATGYRTRTGTSGSFGGNNFNIFWTAGGCFNFYVDTTNEGQAGTTCPSDKRLKTDITPISDALSQINLLKPITFNWKQGTDNGTDLQTGFLAQDVMQIFPELVDHTDQVTPWTPDGMYRLNYVGLISPAIRAIQELSATQSAHTTQLANLTLNTTGDIAIQDATPSADFSTPHYYTLSDVLGNPISQMGAFLELAVANLRAGSIQAQQVIANSLAITTANITVAGQSLHDYIAGVVNEVMSQNGQSGNLAQSNSVKTNIISPLSGNNIAIRLKNSGIEIAKDASSSAVASFDNNGNATFSGTLNSQNLAVNGDATISGTLHANNIEANTISGLQAVVSTLSAQNITNVTNIFFATPSATPNGGNIATGLGNSSSPSGSLLAGSGNFTDIASFSAYFAYVPNLKATTGIFNDGLTSLGGTSLADTTINGQLSIGSQLILADTSVNVLGADFAIQPLRQGGVNFEGGLIAIDTSGNLTVNGNSFFKGNLAVNTLSPLAGQDFNINLQNGAASGSANANFNVKNASGSAVFALNQLGDLVASGTATVNKLNFALVQPAYAISDTEVVATGSAGTAAIKAHQKEITIDNPNVTTQSLIYITPVGTNQTPYLERQVSGKSFTVGIPVAGITDVNFNWLIVN